MEGGAVRSLGLDAQGLRTKSQTLEYNLGV